MTTHNPEECQCCKEQSRLSQYNTGMIGILLEHLMQAIPPGQQEILCDEVEMQYKIYQEDLAKDS